MVGVCVYVCVHDGDVMMCFCVCVYFEPARIFCLVFVLCVSL